MIDLAGNMADRDSGDRMSDRDKLYKKLGTLKRSVRSDWATSIEEQVLDLLPMPAYYDLAATQPINFNEFSYTEFVNGFWVYTASIEITCRIIEECSQERSDNDLEEFMSGFVDKYEMTSFDIDDAKEIKHLCFLPGTNMMDLVSFESIARERKKHENIYFKPHPLTSAGTMNHIINYLGKSFILDKSLSAYQLMKNADVIYTTTTSELALVAVALGKKLVNISSPFYENSGAYYPVSRILFDKCDGNTKKMQRALANIVNSKKSGILFPWHNNIEERIKLFSDRALQLREKYKPIVPPVQVLPFYKRRAKRLNEKEIEARKQEEAKKLSTIPRAINAPVEAPNIKVNFK